MRRKILVVNDIHVGSPSGLLHPNYIDIDGNGTLLNPRQNYLWDNYIRILDLLPTDIDEIVFLGDAIDGKQRANQGEELTLHRTEDQRLAAIMTLQEVKLRLPNASWHFVMGTPYHELASEVRAIARNFTTEIPEMTFRMWAGKARLLFHHEVAYSNATQKAASLEREITRGQLSVIQHGWSDYHAQIRAHVHYFTHVGRRGHLAVSCPCFQMMSPFALKSSPFATIPDLGMLILHVDDSLLDNGMCPVSVEEFLFYHPEPEASQIIDDTEILSENTSDKTNAASACSD